MRSLLDQLDSESMLLMYVCGELASADRAQVERRLKEDASLRDQLEAIRGAHGAVAAALRKLDASSALPGSAVAGARQAGRHIRQWQADRAVQSARPRAPRENLRFPWWSYPLAAAAAVTFAFVAWWINLPEPTRLAGVPQSDEIASPTSQVVDTPGIVQLATITSLDDPRGDLSSLEQDLLAVQALGDGLQ
jgi:hypothetical protein